MSRSRGVPAQSDELSLCACVRWKTRDGKARRGTCVFVAPDRVITALHNVRSSELKEGSLRVSVPSPSRDDLAPESMIEVAEIIWPERASDASKHDIAVVGLSRAVTLPRVAAKVSLSGQKAGVQWRTRAFVVLGRGARHEAHEQFGGPIPSGIAEDGADVDLVVTDHLRAAPSDRFAPWGGISGAPVFVNGEVVAIIKGGEETREKSVLSARSLIALRNDEAFLAAIGVRRQDHRSIAQAVWSALQPAPSDDVVNTVATSLGVSIQGSSAGVQLVEAMLAFDARSASQRVLQTIIEWEGGVRANTPPSRIGECARVARQLLFAALPHLERGESVVTADLAELEAAALSARPVDLHRLEPGDLIYSPWAVPHMPSAGLDPNADQFIVDVVQELSAILGLDFGPEETKKPRSSVSSRIDQIRAELRNRRAIPDPLRRPLHVPVETSDAAASRVCLHRRHVEQIRARLPELLCIEITASEVQEIKDYQFDLAIAIKQVTLKSSNLEKHAKNS